jgi:hypothetical protein
MLVVCGSFLPESSQAALPGCGPIAAVKPHANGWQLMEIDNEVSID